MISQLSEFMSIDALLRGHRNPPPDRYRMLTTVRFSILTTVRFSILTSVLLDTTAQQTADQQS